MSDPSDALKKELLEVRQTLGWMDLVVGSIDDAVYVVDDDKRIIFANQHFSDILGIPRVYLLGEYLDEVFKVKGNKKLEKHYSHVSQTEQDGIYSWRKDDKDYILKISTKNLFATHQVVYLAQDITAEYELFLMKNNFIDLASHQLRTPMTAIMTYAHMLNDGYGGKITKSQRNLTNSIMTASERMNALINDILQITKLQNHESPNEIQNFHLGSIVNTVESELQENIIKKNITFRKVIPVDMPNIVTNERALREILSNILVNAVQYTNESGKISITARNTNNHTIIAISDNGIGIPASDQPKIFEQFSRAGNAFSVFNEGTGLGLYLVKLLVDKIKGTIECKSVENEGTTFTIKIPKIISSD